MKVGDKVKHADADRASIPAYRAMWGRLTWVSPTRSAVTVAWFCGHTGEAIGADVYPRPAYDVVVVPE